MMKAFVNTLLFLLIFGHLKSEKADSLLNFYNRLPDDSTKIIALYDLAYEYRIKDIIAAKHFALACLKSAEKTNNKNLLSKAYNVSGVLLYRSGHLNQARILLNKCLELLREMRDDAGIANLNINLGNLEQLSGNYEKALKHFEESEKIFAAKQNAEPLNQCMLNKGSVFFDLKKYDEAFDAFQSAMKLAIDRKDQYLEAAALNNLSVIFRLRKQYEEALNSAYKAFIINDMIDNEVEKADNYLSLGETYQAMGIGDSAMYYWKLSQQIAERENYTETEREACLLLVPVLESKGDFKEALYFQKRIQILTTKQEPLNELDASFVIDETKNSKTGLQSNLFYGLIIILVVLIIYLILRKRN